MDKKSQKDGGLGTKRGQESEEAFGKSGCEPGRFGYLEAEVGTA